MKNADESEKWNAVNWEYVTIHAKTNHKSAKKYF